MKSGTLSTLHLPPALPVFAVCGRSGSGKTHLLEQVIPRLKQRGLHVAVLKHSHHVLDVDRPEKDSARLFRSGADVFMTGKDETLVRLQESSENPWTRQALWKDYDLLLVEGHKDSPLPKVWLLDPGDTVPRHISQVLSLLPAGPDRIESFLKILESWLEGVWLEPSVLGCVLIGGKSRRMGFPKHLIEQDGKSWIQRSVELLSQITDGVVLAGLGEIPAQIGSTFVLPDAPDAEGPLAGVLSAFRWAPHATWIVTACDMPRISQDALDWLLHTRAPGIWGTLPRLDPSQTNVEPLLAHYDWRAGHLIEELARNRNFSLASLQRHKKIQAPVPPESLRAAWQDVNTPTQLQQLG